MKQKKRDLLLITLMYLVATIVAAGVVWAMPEMDIMWQMLTLDIVMTLVIYICTIIWHNSSIYDPYWSVVPMGLSIWLLLDAMHQGAPIGIWHILLLLAFNLWGLRLTLNWVRTTTGLDWEDWRYRMFRENNGPIMWQFLNFTGIQMMPTLIVFVGFAPMFAIFSRELTAWSLIGDVLILLGVALEHFADTAMADFLKESAGSSATGNAPKQVCRRGLWRYSRHPNYLGEITVWWGVFIVLLSSSPMDKSLWLYGIGAVAMVILFNVVSIPMMERRQLARRPDYAAYRRSTSRLLLFPPKE